MRYLGNKTTILSDIESLLKEKGLLDQRMVLFDAFCGSGSVSDYFKNYFDIIINDNLSWAVVYTKGRLCAHKCNFTKLGFDPFEYFNSNDKVMEGFFFNNYSPANSNRMYFSAENASRIDYFRCQIEQWNMDGLLHEYEYSYLLACLIESVSDVSNTAGVYGAFLKKWDSRALKSIIFDKVDSVESSNFKFQTYNEKIENVIETVNCDILYLDPPYTQNQYGTQYHILETLVLYDTPKISEITGSRSTTPMRSDWSKDTKTHILFDFVLAKTQAKHIVFSYNNKGFMSEEFIEASLKRYGKPETYVCKKINYKKYQNWKSCDKKEHFEYLFYIEKKENEKIRYESPLNYIGSKSKVVDSIKTYAPNKFDVFVDAFGGGFNVGVNFTSDKVIYNDINCFVRNLIESFRKYDTYEYIQYMRKIIKKFGLEKANAENYQTVRKLYNSQPIEKRDSRLLFTLILYGYQQQIRFNGNHDFNNPVGMRWFNDKILEKMISFSRKIKEDHYDFKCASYLTIQESIDENSFIYMDPPYTLTTGSYNDGKRGFKGWNKELECELFTFADKLTARKIPFMLSYVIEHKGNTNNELVKWISTNNYKVIRLGDVIGISGSRRKEVLIINYEL